MFYFTKKKIQFFFFQAHSPLLYQCINIPNNQQPNRGIKKHWNPKFKWLRQKKVIKVELPNFHEKDEEISEDEKKRRMKERGFQPARPWTERPFVLSAVSMPCHSIIYHSKLIDEFKNLDRSNIRTIRSTRRRWKTIKIHRRWHKTNV